MSSSYQSLRDRQVGECTLTLDIGDARLTVPASIERILNLNHIPQESSDIHHDSSAANGLIPKSTPILNPDGELVWKVLVFDGLGQDVISSVLRVNDLRAWGITIHL